MAKATNFFYCLLFTGASLTFSASGVRADEARLNLDAGALVLERNDQIDLRSQDVYLSADRIRASHRFWNRGDRDITLKVTFPMPDITGERDLAIALPNPASPNFLNFQAASRDSGKARGKNGGKAVQPAIEQHAVFIGENGKEEDITDLLKNLSIPLIPIGNQTEEALRKLSQADRGKLASSHYISVDGDTLTPLWTLRSKLSFDQVFPAGRELAIEQTYTPSVGVAGGLYFDKTNLTGESLKQYQKKYCTNAGFLRAADLLTKRVAAGKQAKPDGLQARQSYFGYVLKSSEQAQPIGRFRLVIDKAYPDNLVSFCADGARKVSSTRYEMSRTNYVPDRNIDVLILDRHAAPKP